MDTVRLYPAGDTLASRLDNLGRGIELVRRQKFIIMRTGGAAPARCTVLYQEGIGRSSLSAATMSDPVRSSSRLTMGSQPVMISSRPCPARLSCAQARTASAQSVEPSA